jgi:hypothetical protein
MQRAFSRSLPAAVLIVLCIAAGPGAATAATMAGSVIGLSGQITVERGGQRYGLRIGDPVYTEDSFQVPGGSKLKLRMGDGSILALAPDTTLRIDAYALDAYGRRQSAGVSLGGGLLRAVTAPASQPASFEVNTAVGTSGARSTDWFIEAGPGFAQTSVLYGSVAVTSRATGRSVLVPQGTASRVDAGRDPTPPRPVSPAEFATLTDRTEGGAAPPPPYAPAPPMYNPYPQRGPVIRLPIPYPGGDGRRQDGRGDRGGDHQEPRGRGSYPQ